MASSVLTSGTAQASTSGTSIDFTGIPSWVKRITVMFNGVSTNGVTDWGVQIGYSGGVKATGYVGATGNSGGVNIFATTCAQAVYSASAATVATGKITIELTNASTNAWTISGNNATSGYTYSVHGSGYSNTLSGTLDRIRITTVNGTDTFDAGSINIMYE
jgi:hypothetical protein